MIHGNKLSFPIFLLSLFLILSHPHALIQFPLHPVSPYATAFLLFPLFPFLFYYPPRVPFSLSLSRITLHCFPPPPFTNFSFSSPPFFPFFSFFLLFPLLYSSILHSSFLSHFLFLSPIPLRHFSPFLSFFLVTLVHTFSHFFSNSFFSPSSTSFSSPSTTLDLRFSPPFLSINLPSCVSQIFFKYFSKTYKRKQTYPKAAISYDTFLAKGD